MTRKQKRLSVIAGLGAVLIAATILILTALREQIVFFYSPTELQSQTLAPDRALRIGGLVQTGSVVQAGERVSFIVTDGDNQVTTHYVGLLPDLFEEGQGVIAEGRVNPDGSFAAETILAKHDENYVPKEVAEALKARGEWRPDAAADGS